MNSAQTPLLSKIFQDGGSAFSSSPHTGLLWALEMLAWSDEHGPAAIELLGRLAEIDPGGKLANRPSRSLVDIFRPWMPQTSLDLAQRVAAIDMLRRNHQNVAWMVMLALLPEHHGVGHYTSGPRFRGWKPTEELPVTYADVWEFSTAIAKRLLEDVTLDEARWPEVVERLDRFPPVERSVALQQLREHAEDQTWSAEAHERIWRELDELGRKHLAFAKADWALPREESEELADTADAIQPRDPVVAASWLFDEHLPNLGDERLDFGAQEARAMDARASAIRRLLEASGIDGVLRLAARTRNPWLVGSVLATVSADEFEDGLVQLLDNEDQSLVEAASGFVVDRTRTEGEAWIDRWLAGLSERPMAQVRLLLLDADTERAWSRLAELTQDRRDAYWREFRVYGLGDFGAVNEAARQLMHVGRTLAALDLMALYLNREDRRVDPSLIVEGLQALAAGDVEEDGFTRVTSYELGELLNYLRLSDIDEDALAQLEWQLRPALEFDAESPALERRLAREPAFFVEVLSLVYKPRNSDTQPDVSESLTENAWRILHEWKIVPGSEQRHGDVDPTQLETWLVEARERAGAVDRAETGDLHIGMVFAHSKWDEDGTWPTRAVRDAIERLASAQIDDGFRTQTFNNRGVSSRGIYDGGTQERDLAAQYSSLAAQLRSQWQRTAGILQSLAQDYERQAARLDEETEQLREQLGRG